jgi:hypothetical protein
MLVNFVHPQKPHLDVVKHIYKYVEGTIDMGLFYQKGKDFFVQTFICRLGQW